jgi:ABC-2 type transport system ATP-binding protein
MELMVEELAKKYGTRQVLGPLSLHLGDGIHGLLGPNGAGKTTFMRLLATLLEPSGGRATMNGIPLKEKPAIREMVGYLPQEFSFYPGMTVWEAMDYLALLSGVGDKRERRRRIEELLEKVNLADYRKTKFKALSGGMKRRLGVAQAMVHEPKLLIVDEPTAGLDPEERIRLRQLLYQFAENRTVILSTHLLEDVVTTCSRITLLNRGGIQYHGTVEDLEKQAEGRVWTVELDRGRLESARSRYTVLSALEEGSAVQVRLLSEDCPFPGAQRAAPAIEDAYLYMLRGERSAD